MVKRKKEAKKLPDIKRFLDIFPKNLNWKRKNYKIDGQDLPSDKRATPNWVLFLSLGIGAAIFVGFNLTFSYLYSLFPLVIQLMSKKISSSEYNLAAKQVERDMIGNALFLRLPIFVYLVALVIAGILGSLLYRKLKFRFIILDRGQKGDSRLTTLKEIRQQYKAIPDRKKAFKGMGGVPISHFNKKYFIDTNTVNTAYIGVSRSGKGEMYVTTKQDIVSRAEDKGSMLTNDVKGELYAAAKDTLDLRGYLTLALNLVNPEQSLSYDLLSIIKDYWLDGDIDNVQLLVNSLTYTLYHQEKSSGNAAHFNETAQGLVNAVILALLEECSLRNELHKVIMFNVAQFVIEMGSDRWIDPFTMQPKNALDEYFNSLPQGSLAKGQYASVNFAGDREKGSILSTAIRGLRIFQFPSIAKMTAKNSFDFKRLGFPKDIKAFFDPAMFNKQVSVSFVRNKKELAHFTMKPMKSGIATLNFPTELQNGDYVKLKYVDENRKERRAIFSIELSSDPKGYDTNLVEVAKNMTTLKSIKMSYNSQPIAVYMITPDSDKSLHPIASIFVNQVYQTLIKNCAITVGGACFTRVHIDFDEFGGMSPISNLDAYVVACLGRNILFNFFIQSFYQFYKGYGKENGKIIKENCQNTVYIMSGDSDTIAEISKEVGSSTILESSSSRKALSLNNNASVKPEGEKLLTPERLGTLLEGETVVLRKLHRKDKRGRKIRPYPIFNTKETSMPYRYEFLADEFDTRKDVNEIPFESEHNYLNLEDYEIDFSSFLDRPSPYVVSDGVEVKKPEPETIDELLSRYSIPLEDREKILRSLEENDTAALVTVKTTIKDSEAIDAIVDFINKNYTRNK
ncbi:type IV secretory pathway TraG/TraD family ATPase VirD4 [Enterococcus sp. PF1-24]|uniref:VirD4-like conjugal transfer protein, CD1115 family n=1 Tax=unclassified Enterococcus TaxID=2608891 RepID=UPI002476469E|nr:MULTISPECIES: type IV secretory system conjugative DNA transfer family protein [unclassified Enterococcus]MDH6364512.1 type IV secretory pathway TraG/TraD family ATPase VirD4 [Enterococcus sp. PFB1-1]MDH6401611.1 type IV secretory pathway TraG/TraD family ATPase VirD4 [Enterococcus sp. PF1-24]